MRNLIEDTISFTAVAAFIGAAILWLPTVAAAFH
jgi:hypothetical protein